jgi:hypothetical protein
MTDLVDGVLPKRNVSTGRRSPIPSDEEISR